MYLLYKKILLLVSLLFCGIGISSAQQVSKNHHTELFWKAYDLYQHKMYSQAATEFDAVAKQNKDDDALAYALLCRLKLKTDFYELSVSEFEKECPNSFLLPQIYLEYAYNLFDKEAYKDASMYFDKIKEDAVYSYQRPEFYFKRAYSDFQTTNYNSALFWFSKVDLLTRSDYTAAARYAIAYIYYERKSFKEAVYWFERSRYDTRFTAIADYYIMECKFMLKDYAYVTANANRIFAQAPQQRKAHLARLISETYLLLNQPAKAKKYYDTFRSSSATASREDIFYAGSLLYALKDYKGAIEKFQEMKDRTDSLGQIANYQMAYSYIQLKNKLKAMEAFKMASESKIDKKISEDAYYNYAKLCFDINKDASVFANYMKTYSNKPKNDLIYSYMALAALYEHDYSAALEAYDNINDLDEDMTNNYMRANYLKASELYGKGAYRDAAKYLKIATYYSNKYSTFNQLSKYWLAESYFRADDLNAALKIFKELYNMSALSNSPEGELLSYAIAYCYLEKQDYSNATRWFNTYLDDKGLVYKKDAMLRLADCAFAVKDYAAAADMYKQAMLYHFDPNDVYPYYMAGISYGLNKDLSGKIEYLSKVKNADPSSEYYALAMNELAKSYLADNKIDEAIDIYGKLEHNMSDSDVRAEALLNLALLARNKSDNELALRKYKKIVSSLPQSKYAKEALASIEDIYRDMQEPQEYIAYVDSLDNNNLSDLDKSSVYLNSIQQSYLDENYSKTLSLLQAYQDQFPSDSVNVSRLNFYYAEAYRHLDKKDIALEYYQKLDNIDTLNFAQQAFLNYASLSNELEQYDLAYEAYEHLYNIAKFEENKTLAKIGMLNSSFKSKHYDLAIKSADLVLTSKPLSKEIAREASYIKAMSLLATSHRSEAFVIFKQLAKDLGTKEGAESNYLLIKDLFDRGDYVAMENRIFDFSKKAKTQSFYLAKAFILLGDSYVERGDYEQARATFESIRDAYNSANADQIRESIEMRLEKLSQLEK